MERESWIAEHLPPPLASRAGARGSEGLPPGHGLLQRCTDPSGKSLARGCYSFDLAPAAPGEPPLHFIALDTAAAEGLDTGNLDGPEWDWLEKDLESHSACAFPPGEGECRPTGGRFHLIVVMAHHPEGSLDNTAPRTDGVTQHTGAELRELLRFPGVILFVNGHTHTDSIEARKLHREGGRRCPSRPRKPLLEGGSNP